MEMNNIDAQHLQQSFFDSVQVSDEAFKLFHSIDRDLFTRLLHTLGRDPTESVRVMAFWMWLEREGNDMSLINTFLSLPLPLLNRLADETVLCLLCLQTDRFIHIPLSLLPGIVNDRITNVVSLRLFHENRIAVAQALARIINTVCTRAFADILGGVPPLLHHQHGPNHHVNVQAPPGGTLHMQMAANNDGEVADSMSMDNINQVISNIIDDDDDDDDEVPADDRTIFLTFSKGYPITQDELTEFFTRRFGDFIEDLIMQEVGDDEQVLYARMVAKTTELIDRIVGWSKAKYVINGKHVWARKYVKKQQQSMPRCQDPSSSSPS